MQTLKGIEETFDVALDLSTEGRAVVFADNAENVAGAVKLVRELVHEIEEVRACRRGFVWRMSLHNSRWSATGKLASWLRLMGKL